MSKKLERSRDEELEREKQLSKLQKEKEIKNRSLTELSNNINFKKDNKNDNSLESESDEYIEEEDEEEDGEIDDDDEDDINKEFKKNKKRKLEEPIIKWSRKKSEVMAIESDDSLSNADIVIKNPEIIDKTEVQKKEKFISIPDDSKTQIDNYKKANFYTTPNDISAEGLNNLKKVEQKNPLNYFSINNDLKDNKNAKTQNNQNIINDNPNSVHFSNTMKMDKVINNNDNSMKCAKIINPNIITLSNNLSNSYNSNSQNNNDNNDNKSKFLHPENIFSSEVKKLNVTTSIYQSSSQYQQPKKTIFIPEIFNSFKLKPLIKEKIFLKYRFKNLPPDLEKILFFLQDKLKIYLKIYLSRLISISRIRNVNFNLYSNNPNGQIHYKFKTFNWDISNDKVTFSQAKIFDILFTSNFKKKFDLIEEYVELNNKKTKFEKLSSCKEKYEESNKTKGIESSIKITDGPNPTIKLLPGRRTKKKNNTFFKEMRKKIVQTKKKEDLNKQKSYTKNTLDAFLSDNTNKNLQSNFGNLSNFVEGNNSTLLDVSSRMSDTMSHNNLSYTNNNINNSVQNEISMNVFTHFEPTKDGKIFRPQKKKINLKDFIFLLENSTEYIPNKILLLNKAAIDNTKNK